jgi:transaldolase / glucose-6-phosphate isomerase
VFKGDPSRETISLGDRDSAVVTGPNAGLPRPGNDPETYTSGHGDYDRGVTDEPLTIEARIPASLGAALREKLALAEKQSVANRLLALDSTLWAPQGTPEVADRLGWMTIAERMLEELDGLETFVEQVVEDGIEDVLLLGMGGSSLAPEVLRRSFAHHGGHPRLHVLDSTDAAGVLSVEQAIDPAKTLFIVSSKSGGTIEPLSLFAHFWSLIEDGSHFVAITDPGSGLEKLAEQHGFRRVFHGDPNIGGRYSALSAFGIVPGALMGADVRALLMGAPLAWQMPVEEVLDGAPNTAEEERAPTWLGCALAAFAQAGRDKLTFVIAETLPGLGLWLEQLVAESTGKHGTGILPVADEPLGELGVYGEDRVFAYLPDRASPDPEMDAAVQALAQAGHPVFTIPTSGPRDLGRIFMLAELAVAVAGWGLQINPFDQPNVQQAKDATNKVLASYEAAHELPDVAEADEQALGELTLAGAPPDYVTLMVYAQGDDELDEALGELRAAIRAASKVTTTCGYGPRFLHSTGQFHKGGPKTGRFLQLLHDGPTDVEIPGRPFTFTTLKNAQAIGDFETLRGLGLPAERLRLQGDDLPSAVRALTSAIEKHRAG